MKPFQQQPGRLAIIGGRLEKDNVVIFDRIRSLSKEKIAIIALASEAPLEIGQEMVEIFKLNSIEATLLPLYWGDAFAPYDQKIIQLIETFESVFFTGGDQRKIVDTLIQDGVETPVLRAIRRVHLRGGLIAGSSAGAAIMSPQMILGGTSGEALAFGRVEGAHIPGLSLAEGLGFFHWGIVDQHFIARGRIARLVIALCSTEYSYGFGIDENTALFVDGGHASVRGENGVIIVNRKIARISRNDGIENIKISLLDDGDSYDLDHHKVIPHQEKKRIRVTKSSFQKPAPIKRCAFGSYTLHELMLRLAKGDPAHYLRDSAFSWPDKSAIEWCVEVERLPKFSRALAAKTQGTTRYTLLDFYLHIHRAPKIPDHETQPLIPHHHLHKPLKSNIVLLGSWPRSWQRHHIDLLRPYLLEPIGVIATASLHAKRVALEYIDWLNDLNLKAVDISVDESNIEEHNRDPSFLRSIARLGSILFTGGNQHRLMQLLTYRGEITPLLQELFDAFERKTNIIAIGGAASALGKRMIAEGDSCHALRIGSSEDAGSMGIVMEQGLGFFEEGIIDQNFLNEGRLGRLLVACGEEKIPYGFGICEESALVIQGGEKTIQAMGVHGAVIMALDSSKCTATRELFHAREIELYHIPPGCSFNLDERTILGSHASSPPLLQKFVAQIPEKCKKKLEAEGLYEEGWLQLIYTPSRSKCKATLEVRTLRRAP